MGFLIGGVFFQIQNTQQDASKKTAFLFFCCINQGCSGALSTVTSFPDDRVLSLHERRCGAYKTSS